VCRAVAIGEFDRGQELVQFTDVAKRYVVHKIAVETPLKPYVYGRGATGGAGVQRAVIMSLMECARLAGQMEGQALLLGIPVVVNDADRVRRALGIGGRTETERDRAVKGYVKLHVRGWPKQSNADERDAAAVAIYGHRCSRQGA
jgi:hypothetical protein